MGRLIKVTAGAGVTGRARPRRLFNGSLKCSANVFLSVYVTFLARQQVWIPLNHMPLVVRAGPLADGRCPYSRHARCYLTVSLLGWAEETHVQRLQCGRGWIFFRPE